MDKEKADTVAKYKSLDCKIKESCWADKREWLENKGAEVQEAVNKSDTKMLYYIVQELRGQEATQMLISKTRMVRFYLVKMNKMCIR